MRSTSNQKKTARGGAAAKCTRIQRQVLPPRVLAAPEAAEYIGIPQSTLQTLAHRGALPYICYPLHWSKPSYKMFFDVRDLDAFVEANKEFRYEHPDGKKHLNIRDANEVGNTLLRNQLESSPRRKTQLVSTIPPTAEDVLKLVIQSKSMQGFLEGATDLASAGAGGLSSQVCLQAFVIGWYSRQLVTDETLKEVGTAVSELPAPPPEEPLKARRSPFYDRDWRLRYR